LGPDPQQAVSIPGGGIRLRPAARADDPFFREMEFQTTWESLDDADRRRLGPQDIRDALRITHEVLLSRPGNRIVIAEDEQGERLGLLWFGINRNLVTGQEEAWIYNISVVPEHRGRGIGRVLMEHAEALARDGGFPILGLMVSSHNARARRLYEHLHFEASNIVMRKRLSVEES
jgi:ribosomal protein S18 acetylase RimI-like enzyme